MKRTFPHSTSIQWWNAKLTTQIPICDVEV